MNSQSVETNEVHETLDAPIGPQAGTLLRQKRESLNLSPQQVADRLRLKIEIIQSIENNNFELDKVKTFIRGYLRSYARLVGLSEAVVLKAYDDHSGSGSQDQEVTMRSFSRRTKREAHNSRINLISLAILLLVIGISTTWWYQNSTQDLLFSGSASTPSERVNSETDGFTTVNELLAQEATDTEETTEMAQPQSDEAMDSELNTPTDAEEPSQIIEERDEPLPEVLNQTQVEVNNLPQNPVDDVLSEPVVVPVQSASLITMEFAQDCWVQVKDATGKTLVTGVRRANTQLNLDGEAPFSVVLGVPESVSITFASEPVDLSGYTAGKVARFTLPR